MDLLTAHQYLYPLNATRGELPVTLTSFRATFSESRAWPHELEDVHAVVRTDIYVILLSVRCTTRRPRVSVLGTVVSPVKYSARGGIPCVAVDFHAIPSTEDG